MSRVEESQGRLYFGYGRNMHPEIMAERCIAAAFVGVALLDKHRIMINGRGVSTVVPGDGHSVHGVLWTLSRQCETALDIVEGVAEGHYRKDEVHLQIVGGAAGPALIYLAADTRVGRPREGYLETLEEAAARHGFPASYRQHLAGLR